MNEVRGWIEIVMMAAITLAIILFLGAIGVGCVVGTKPTEHTVDVWKVQPDGSKRLETYKMKITESDRRYLPKEFYEKKEMLATGD